ncbi:hypothetical protein MKZ38_000286 [Zalerion maritima]|uniref:Superoxide dismutase 1 copper chaperone n=1 Tax=Zalerion maritima TaxID=339359 RepID=A0AAD5WUP9_9PEZI|nr:hypothetical protein MKZ38_000286 [Zalerion maritima]
MNLKAVNPADPAPNYFGPFGNPFSILISQQPLVLITSIHSGIRLSTQYKKELFRLLFEFPHPRQILSVSSASEAEAIIMTVAQPFQTLFAVPMTCDGCVKAVSDALYRLEGITKVEAMLADQLVRIEGTALEDSISVQNWDSGDDPRRSDGKYVHSLQAESHKTAPSSIVQAIQDTGKDAILRGSGASNSAAVAILETYAHTPDGKIIKVPNVGGNWVSPRRVRGLARMVQVSPSSTVIDLNVRGISEGTYQVTIHSYGDLSEGVRSTGSVWKENGQVRGDLGKVVVDNQENGDLFVARDFQVWEVIGHALVVTKQNPSTNAEEEEEPMKNDDDTILGVLARSAGVWDNDKTVCSCTGKTLWEERKDEVKKGMI